MCLLRHRRFGRSPVGQLDEYDSEDYVGTALIDAVRHGHVDIVKKFKIDPARDNLNQLLSEGWLTAQPDIAELLIGLGANVQARGDHYTPVEAAFLSLEWSLDSVFASNWYTSSRTEASLRTIEILAAHGAQWQPEDRYRLSSFRRTLGKLSPYDAVRHLCRIIKGGPLNNRCFGN